MNHDAEHPVFATEQGSRVPERDRATPAKRWATPKVIVTSNLSEDTESAAGAATDGLGAGHS
jgi:hypothetical protein